MKNDVTGRSKSIQQLANNLIRQLQGVTIADAKNALDYAASFLDETQIVQAGKKLPAIRVPFRSPLRTPQKPN